MRMHIRNVRTYGHRRIHVYIYIVRLIIEHPREWLASLADNVFQHSLVWGSKFKCPCFPIQPFLRTPELTTEYESETDVIGTETFILSFSCIVVGCLGPPLYLYSVISM